MSKIYISQPVDLTAVVNLGPSSLSLDDVVSVEFQYTKPDLSTGTFTATWNLTSLTITYSMSTSENNQSGKWIFQGELTFPGAVVVPATAFELLVHARYT